MVGTIWFKIYIKIMWISNLFDVVLLTMWVKATVSTVPFFFWHQIYSHNILCTILCNMMFENDESHKMLTAYTMYLD